MICIICRQADLIEGVTTATLERGEIRLTISGVPAWICPNCGEAVADEDVALRLLEGAESVTLMGIHENAVQYGKLPN